MPPFQHLAEHPVGIVATLVSAIGVLIVDPGKHDHLGSRVVAVEQAVLLEELRPEPMLAISAKSTALTVLWPRGVLWNDIEGQFGDRRQSLAGVLLHVPDRVCLL
jgi:hypothetical protein